MATNRLLRSATQALARKQRKDSVSDVLLGPDTTFRSELIEMLYARGGQVS